VFNERRVPETMLTLGMFRRFDVRRWGAIGLLINCGFYGGLSSASVLPANCAAPHSAGGAPGLPQLGMIMARFTSVSARISARAGGPPPLSILLRPERLGIGVSGCC